MSDSSHPRRVLHLVVEGFPADKLAALESEAASSTGTTEILHLTEANAREALEKIFAADTVAVWTKIDGP